MLSHLHITNFGLIDDLSLDFTPQLNVLTGETGAGKSIIIDALRCALGERLSSTYIRDGQKPCVLETVFECNSYFLQSHPDIAEFMPEQDSSLIIRRTVLPDGRNKIKINQHSVTVSTLKVIGDRLIDFHGPHDHQMLLNEESHINILDRLSKNSNRINHYRNVYEKYRSIIGSIDDIEDQKASRERDLDLLTHQIRELEQVPLDPARYDEYMQAYTRFSNMEKLFEHSQALLTILEQDEIGLSDQVAKAFPHMRAITGADETVSHFEESLNTVQELIDSVSVDLRDYLDSLAYSQDESSEITRIYDAYADILRKYGPTVEKAAAHYKEIKTKRDFLVNIEHSDFELQKELKETKERLLDQAADISRVRKKTAARLKKTIEKELKELGITHVQFECRITSCECNQYGTDRIAFYISPNAGEDVKPMAEIVSSGEAARVMLALKKALTKVDPIPVLIFDEIDAQIGGRLGNITGSKLREISHDRQILLITHLPQIACYGTCHYKVLKRVENNHTHVTVRKLEGQNKIDELAQMMSGDNSDELSKKHAREMLAKAGKQ